MSPTAWIVLLWIAFGGTHMVLSSLRLRPRLVRTLGERGFQGAYSLVAFATFVPLVWVYFANKHEGPLLWAVALSPALRWTLYVLMGAAFSLVVSAMATPSPVAIGAPEKVEPRGVHRITRHGLLMGTGLFGLLHLVANGYASDVAFFAGFPIFAIVGCLHQDQRKLATLEGYREFCANTPFIPFTGRATLRGLRELSPVPIGIAVVITVALRWWHGLLFGG